MMNRGRFGFVSRAEKSFLSGGSSVVPAVRPLGSMDTLFESSKGGVDRSGRAVLMRGTYGDSIVNRPENRTR